MTTPTKPFVEFAIDGKVVSKGEWYAQYDRTVSASGLIRSRKTDRNTPFMLTIPSTSLSLHPTQIKCPLCGRFYLGIFNAGWLSALLCIPCRWVTEDVPKDRDLP